MARPGVWVLLIAQLLLRTAPMRWNGREMVRDSVPQSARGNDCDPRPSKCNVCKACCSPFLAHEQHYCDSCAKASCHLNSARPKPKNTAQDAKAAAEAQLRHTPQFQSKTRASRSGQKGAMSAMEARALAEEAQRARSGQVPSTAQAKLVEDELRGFKEAAKKHGMALIFQDLV